MADTGVTLSLDSSNANVANDGTITYTNSEVVGNVIVNINKINGEPDSKTISITIPAQAGLTADYTITKSGASFQVNGGGAYAAISDALAICTNAGGDGTLVIKFGSALH
jgi:Fe-S cluster assembly iron-binding protein IscA